MPSLAIRAIDTTDGLRITCGGGLPSIQRDGATIVAAPGNLKQKEKAVNEWLQAQYEHRIPLADLPPDDRALEDPPVLLPHERIDGSDWVGTLMYVQVTIESLSPLKLLPRCSKEPIV